MMNFDGNKEEDGSIVESSKGFLKVVIMIFVSVQMIRILTAILKFSTQKRNQTPFPQIPFFVPSPHWLYGHMDHIGNLKGHEMLVMTYADPQSSISTFWGLSKPMLSVLKAQHVRNVLRYSPHRKMLPLLGRHFENLLGKKSVVILTGNEWTNARKIATHAMMQGAMIHNTDILGRILKRIVRKLTTRIRNEPTSSNHHPRCVQMDIREITNAISFETFGMCALGRDFGSSASHHPLGGNDDCFQAFQYLLEDLHLRAYEQPWNIVHYFRWIPLPRNRNVHDAKRTLTYIISESVNRESPKASFSANGSKSNQKPAAQILYELGLRDDDLQDMLLSFWIGGYGTTSVTMTYMFYMVALYPEIQTECVLEIWRLAQKKEKRDYWTALDKHLPYCHAVLLETLRLFPAGSNTSRNLSRELHIPERNITFEKGSRVFLSFWCIHRYEGNFHRPLEFLPQRWVRQVVPTDDDDAENKTWVERSPNDLNSERESTPRTDCPPADKQNLFSFSYGKRHCVGEKFAIRELLMAMVYILPKFHLETVEGYCLTPEKRGILQGPQGSVPILFRERTPSDS